MSDDRMAKAPMRVPCPSCPYRRDAPSGVWADAEYAKLELYDGETFEQPPRLFMCHLDGGHVCAGWAGCHDTAHLLALRMAWVWKTMSPADIEATLDYVSPVPLFSSGREAAEHGRQLIDEPPDEAIEVQEKVIRRRRKRPV